MDYAALGFAIVLIFNAGFLDMVKSWACNVRAYNSGTTGTTSFAFLKNVLFVATDR